MVLRSCEDDQVRVDFMDSAVLIDLAGDTIHQIAGVVMTRFEMVRDAVATGPVVGAPRDGSCLTWPS